MRLLAILFSFILITSTCYAEFLPQVDNLDRGVWIEETDGSPSVLDVVKVIVSNDTVTNTNGRVSLSLLPSGVSASTPTFTGLTLSALTTAGYLKNTTGGVLSGGNFERPVTNGLLFAANFDGVVDAKYSIGSATGTLTTPVSAVWHLTEGTGTTATDDSGNSQTLTFGATTAAPTWVTTGYYETGLSFDGGDSTSRADDPILDMGDGHFSIGFWVYPTDVTSALYFYNKSRLDAVYNGYWIIFNNPTRTVALGMNDAVDSYTYTSAALLNINAWNRVWMTWNNTTETITISINGTVSTGTNSPLDIGNIDTTGAAYLGSYDGTQLFFKGRINDFFIIKGQLLGTAEMDYITINRWYGKTYQDGKFGWGYYAFTGSSLGYANAGNLVKTKGSIDFWFYPSWDGNDSLNHVLFDTETASGTNQLQLIKTSGNVLNFNIGDSAAAVKTLGAAVDATNFAKNTWHHIEVGYDAGTMTFRLNGADFGTSSGAGTGLLTALPTTMYIGRDATSQANEANGIFDELKFNGRAITLAEAKQNYGALNPAIP